MLELPDACSMSAESLELLRKIAVRAVIERGMTHREIAAILGVGENAVGGWCAAYRQDGTGGLEVNPRGRPVGVGRSLSPTAEIVIQAILLDSTLERCGIPLTLRKLKRLHWLRLIQFIQLIHRGFLGLS